MGTVPRWTQKNHDVWQMPWAAPGKAELWSVCGVNGGHKNKNDRDKHGKEYSKPRDGLDMPPSLTTTKWEIGKTAEVGFALTKNHGGGYQWRLCPGYSESSHPPASCFEANPLTFASDTTTVHWTDGHKQSFKAITLSGSHVTPANSQFRTIQIPMTCSHFDGSRTEPCSGCHGVYDKKDDVRQEWPFSLVDTVHVPNVPTGHAWLQWRWDNEHQDQVWTNCADIEIVAGSGPTPSPPSPSPSGGSCLSAGSTLDTDEVLVSPGGKAQLKMQKDGNLVIRDSSDQTHWSTHTTGNSGASLWFHSSDGNLIVKVGHDSTTLWSSKAHSGATEACITDDCSFVVKDTSGHSLWSSGSTCSSAEAEVV